MAIFLSSPWTGARSAMPGERRFAGRLKTLLEDDDLCAFTELMRQDPQLTNPQSSQYEGLLTFELAQGNGHRHR